MAKSKERRAKETSRGGKSVDGYIAGLKGEQAVIVAVVCKLVRAAIPRISEAIKWGQPVFELNGPVCYVKAHANHVTFGFWRGVDLPDPLGLLEGTGGKMRHTKLTRRADVRMKPLQDRAGGRRAESRRRQSESPQEEALALFELQATGWGRIEFKGLLLMAARNRQTRLPGLEPDDAGAPPPSAAREKAAVAAVDPGALAQKDASAPDSPPAPTGDRSVAAVRFVAPPPGDPTTGLPDSLHRPDASMSSMPIRSSFRCSTRCRK